MKENKSAVVESIILLIISFGVLFEGVHLALGVKGVRDIMGPGTYIIVLGAILIFVTLMHIILQLRSFLRQKNKSTENAKVLQKSKTEINVLKMVAVFAFYIVLAQTIGYPIATPVFFLIMFRVTGVTSWGRNVMLTAIFSIVFYIVFVHFCEVIFPRGVFF